jgi:septum formation protein
VYFRSLNLDEINHYVAHFNPLDKAGSYGIQDWIGLIGVEKIDGSYTNVMGLPTHELYQALQKINA